MNYKNPGRLFSMACLLCIAALATGCGGGSSDSGGGFAISPGGTIPANTPTTITQSGSYGLPQVGYLTDIRIDCSAANVDSTANNTSTGRSFSENCNNGLSSFIDFPSGGGSLLIEFNSGSSITVSTSQAQSQSIGNR